MCLVLELVKRDVSGFAIGGLSGGEEKSLFWRMVKLSTDILPRDKPRYLMGVGYVYKPALFLTELSKLSRIKYFLLIENKLFYQLHLLHAKLSE